MDFIDWSVVNWTAVITLSVLVFIAALIGNFFNILFNGNPITGAIIAAILFAGVYIGWKHYPHGIEFFGASTEATLTETEDGN